MNWRGSRADVPRCSEVLRRCWDPCEWSLFALLKRWLQCDHLAVQSYSMGSYSNDRPKLLSDTAEGMTVGNAQKCL